jgi:hypothetical protein
MNLRKLFAVVLIILGGSSLFLKSWLGGALYASFNTFSITLCIDFVLLSLPTIITGILTWNDRNNFAVALVGIDVVLALVGIVLVVIICGFFHVQKYSDIEMVIIGTAVSYIVSALLLLHEARLEETFVDETPKGAT